MESTRSAYSRLSSADEVRETRPFYVIVMIVLAGLYILAYSNSTVLRSPERLVPFTLLMLLHAILHWNSPRLAGNLRLSVLYLAAQGALAFVLPLIAEAEFLVLGLALALVGESVGLLWNAVWGAIAVLFYVALAGLDMLLLSKSNALPEWALAAVPTTIFVVVYVVLYGRQAQARSRAQALLAELDTTHRQLAEYAVRVEDLTLANERQRMARELHDTLAQGLAGLILQLEAASTHLEKGNDDRARTILQQAMARARATLADARLAIDDLRSGQTLAQDWRAAVREQVKHFTDATGIPCELELEPGRELPEAAREQALFVVTEGLANIARHAQAQRAWVRLRGMEGEPVLEVQDDGRGFDPAAVPAAHYGLLGMRERARLAGGALEISSAPGAGTTLRMRLPSGERPK